MKLYVLYDRRCGFCCSCVEWIFAQPALVEFEFLGLGTPECQAVFPQLLTTDDELMVVADNGAVYRGTSAFIMCLYGLDGYRALSYKLATPALMPMAREAFALVSRRRYALSRLLNLEAPQLEHTLRHVIANDDGQLARDMSC